MKEPPRQIESNSFIHDLQSDFLSKRKCRIGFGCGNLYAGREAATSIRVLEEAIDRGIVYFDTARLYGYGKAEGLLGEVIVNKRDKLVIATKAGIWPVSPTLVWRVRAKSAEIARRVRLSRKILEPPPLRPRFNAFGPAEIRESLETSLRQLKTDFIDIFLLHECTLNEATSGDVLDLLGEFKKEGKIKVFGVATQPDISRDIATHGASEHEVIQFKNDPIQEISDDWQVKPRRLIVNHSILGENLSTTRKFMECYEGERYLEEHAKKLSSNSELCAAHLIACALRANSSGAVLFSTSRPERIQRTLEAAELTDEDVALTFELLSDRALSG